MWHGFKACFSFFPHLFRWIQRSEMALLVGPGWLEGKGWRTRKHGKPNRTPKQLQQDMIRHVSSTCTHILICTVHNCILYNMVTNGHVHSCRCRLCRLNHVDHGRLLRWAPRDP